MDAVEYFKEKNRMCDAQESCSKCPLRDEHGNRCHDIEKYFPLTAVEIVEEWTKENPIYTNLDKFKEVFNCTLSKRAFEIDSFFDWLDKEYIE